MQCLNQDHSVPSFWVTLSLLFGLEDLSACFRHAQNGPLFFYKKPCVSRPATPRSSHDSPLRRDSQSWTGIGPETMLQPCCRPANDSILCRHWRWISLARCRRWQRREEKKMGSDLWLPRRVRRMSKRIESTVRSCPRAPAPKRIRHAGEREMKAVGGRVLKGGHAVDRTASTGTARGCWEGRAGGVGWWGTAVAELASGRPACVLSPVLQGLRDFGAKEQSGGGQQAAQARQPPPLRRGPGATEMCPSLAPRAHWRGRAQAALFARSR